MTNMTQKHESTIEVVEVRTFSVRLIDVINAVFSDKEKWKITKRDLKVTEFN